MDDIVCDRAVEAKYERFKGYLDELEEEFLRCLYSDHICEALPQPYDLDLVRERLCDWLSNVLFDEPGYEPPFTY